MLRWEVVPAYVDIIEIGLEGNMVLVDSSWDVCLKARFIDVDDDEDAIAECERRDEESIIGMKIDSAFITSSSCKWRTDVAQLIVLDKETNIVDKASPSFRWM